ncbi:hypothetical protein ACROYT_G004856 [Oculina patagonica]
MDHKERCKYMFNNQILSDVKFVMQASQYGESDNERSKMTIPAHKFLLSICSPVFFAMFCGEMAETKEQIDLPDCEYEAMLELLRYIYTDEVCLNGNNVMQVLYLAEKYMIPCLTDKFAVAKNSAYRIEASLYGDCYMTGKKVIDRYVHSSGVTFEFDHDWFPATDDYGDLDQSVVIAELLFTVKE